MATVPGVQTSCALLRIVCPTLLLYSLLVLCCSVFFHHQGGAQAMRLPRQPSVTLEEDYLLPHEPVKRQYFGTDVMCRSHPRNCKKAKRFSLNLKLEEDGEDPSEEFELDEASRRNIRTHPLFVRVPLLESERGEPDYPSYRLMAFQNRK